MTLPRNWPLFPAGLAGGTLAYSIGLPMPFMLGAIAGAGLAVNGIERSQGPQDLRPPKLLRDVFISLIGAMIGASFTPELLAAMPLFWPSILALLIFIITAQAVGFVVMRRLGGYAAPDAFYASMPGGLIEAAILGEKAGADARLISVQHFIRIMLLVFAMPLIFWIATGDRVGSAAGQQIGDHPAAALDVALIVLLGLSGLAVGRRTPLPASHMMGPMLLCAVLHVVGLISVAPPGWLMHLAQLIVGIGLGAQFSGLTPGMLGRSLWVGVAAVGAMLVVSLGFAAALAPLVPASFATMFLAFAPGGVTEMSLIALSLSLSPVIVAAHHMIRIVATVFLAQGLCARLLIPKHEGKT